MAQRIQTLCDHHQTQGEDLEGETWVFTVSPPGTKAVTYSVDLCPDCAKPATAAMEHLAEIGRVAKGTAKPTRPAPAVPTGAVPATPDHRAAPMTGPVPCPICGDRPNTEQQMRNHLRDAHDTSIATAFDWPESKAPHKCPECGDRFTIPQALGAHRKARHGVGSGQVRAGGD
jgi:hypothetical protein